MENRPDDDVLACLGGMLLLEGLSPEALRRFASVCARKKVPKGCVIFMEGDHADQFYIVMRGSVVEYATGPNDLEMAFKELKRGDYFGEIGILVDEPHYVTAIAAQPSTLLVVPRAEFLARVRAEPSMSQVLLKTMAHRLLLAARHSIAYANLTAASRLAYLVLTLEAQEGRKGAVEHSQEDLAQRCGLARQTVARILGEWREAGWIRTGRGRVEGIDTEALGRLVSISAENPPS